jgi:hypothetical protein
MEIVYCDSCGFRIPEQDLDDIEARRLVDQVLCLKCKPKEAGKTSRGKISARDLPVVAVAPKKTGSGIHPTPRVGDRITATGLAPGTRSTDRVTRSIPKEKSFAVLYAGIGAGVFALVLGAVFLGGKQGNSAAEKSSNASAAREKPHDQPRTTPIENTSKPPAPAPTPSTSKPVPPGPAPDNDAEAKDEYAKLLKFEGLGEMDVDEKVKRLKSFDEKYNSLIIASQARVLARHLESTRADYAGGNGSANWLELGTFTLSGDSLAVVLKDALPTHLVNADAIRFVGGGTTRIINESDAGCVRTGPWKPSTSSTGFKGGSFNSELVGLSSAIYSFSGLTPGTPYKVAVTWVLYSDRSTEVPYMIMDGTTVLGYITVNQKVSPTVSKATSLPVEKAIPENVTIFTQDFEGAELSKNWKSGTLSAMPAHGDSKGSIKGAKHKEVKEFAGAVWYEPPAPTVAFYLTDKTVLSAAVYPTSAEPVRMTWVASVNNTKREVCFKTFDDLKPNEWNSITVRMSEIMKDKVPSFFATAGWGVHFFRFVGGTDKQALDFYVDDIIVREVVRE